MNNAVYLRMNLPAKDKINIFYALICKTFLGGNMHRYKGSVCPSNLYELKTPASGGSKWFICCDVTEHRSATNLQLEPVCERQPIKMKQFPQKMWNSSLLITCHQFTIGVYPGWTHMCRTHPDPPPPSVTVSVLTYTCAGDAPYTIKRIILSFISAGDVHLKAVNYLVNGTPAELTRSEWEASLLDYSQRQLEGGLIQSFLHHSCKNSWAPGAHYLNAFKALYILLLYCDVL